MENKKTYLFDFITGEILTCDPQIEEEIFEERHDNYKDNINVLCGRTFIEGHKVYFFYDATQNEVIQTWMANVIEDMENFSASHWYVK